MVRKVINVISTILLIFLIAVVIFLFVMRASGKSPSIFGYQILRVTTGSMEPELMVGDVIVVKETPVEDIHKGDIVSYESKEGELRGRIITHRVVEEPEKVGGTYYLQTQGDVEGAALDPKITYSQVQGKFQNKIAFLDKMYSFFFTPYGIIIFVFIIVALFGYEIISLIISYKSLDEHDDDYYEPKPKKPSKKRQKNKKTHLK